MRVIVNLDVCDAHGACVIAAPSVFQLGDEGILSYQEWPDPALRSQLTEAVSACPTQAIRLDD